MRLRFRFGLRFLLLSTTLTAAVIGLVERKANQQRTLKAAIQTRYGHFLLTDSYPWMPSKLKKLLGEDRSSHVTSVKLICYSAPNFELTAPHPFGLMSSKKLMQVITKPAMDSVTHVEIIGTSITTEVADLLREKRQLRHLTLQSSMLRRDEIAELRDAMPEECFVDCSTMSHVTHRLRIKYSEQQLPDLTVFSRAREGNADAIREVIDLTTRVRLPFVKDILLAVGAPYRKAILSGLEHPSGLAHLTVLQSTTPGERNDIEFEVLKGCFSDKDVLVRRAAADYLRTHRIEGKQELLELALNDEDFLVRETVKDTTVSL